MMGKKSNQIVATNPMLQAAPVALEGEYLPPEKAPKLEPIPHNDHKAIADAVNEMREKGASETGDDLADEVASLKNRVAEMEEKLERLIETWGDPDDETADKGAAVDPNKH